MRSTHGISLARPYAADTLFRHVHCPFFFTYNRHFASPKTERSEDAALAMRVVMIFAKGRVKRAYRNNPRSGLGI